MTSKQLMQAALNGKRTERIPVTPHWWGLYKFEYAGMIDGYEGEARAWSCTGEQLAEIDRKFYEAFRPDMFHLTTGASQKRESEAERKEKARIREAVRELPSKAVIDAYIDSISETKEEVLESGVFDHIRILSERYGDEVFLMLNEGNSISWLLDPGGCLGFENGLISLIEKPNLMEYLIWRHYDMLLPRMEALREAGGHGYIGSETYCTGDIMSPSLYRSLVFPGQKHFYTSLDKLGLIPTAYFLGDVRPLLDDIKQLGARALLIEESKKTFNLDIAEIYERLEGEMCLFGNLDSVYTMQLGTAAEVERETRRQLAACQNGGFVMANGCPLSFSTPPENIKAMIHTVWEFSV